jgi:hypothetical protein
MPTLTNKHDKSACSINGSFRLYLYLIKLSKRYADQHIIRF